MNIVGFLEANEVRNDCAWRGFSNEWLHSFTALQMLCESEVRPAVFEFCRLSSQNDWSSALIAHRLSTARILSWHGYKGTGGEKDVHLVNWEFMEVAS